MRLFEIQRRKTADELTPAELEERHYMEGQCNVFAIALHSIDPSRFLIGYEIEYHTGVPDMRYEPDEWDTLSRNNKKEIENNSQHWALVHAFVFDKDTKKYLDASGSYNSKNEILSRWATYPDTSKVIFPGSVKQLADIGTMGEFNEQTDTWEIIRGQAFLNKYATEHALKKAQIYAERKFGLTF